MNKTEMETLIRDNVYSNERREITAERQLTVLLAIVDKLFSVEEKVGDSDSLDTDLKSTIVEALNELAGIVENETMIISMFQSNSERKLIYDKCIKHHELAKNIVFLNADDGMHYVVNGYKVVNNVLHLHTIMQSNGELRSVNVKVASNGSISV